MKKLPAKLISHPYSLDCLISAIYTKFYGEDLLNDSDEIPHAFISNYQKVALVKENELTVLAPKRRVEHYSWPKVEATRQNNRSTNDTIAYYQSASWWKEQYKRIPSSVKSQ